MATPPREPPGDASLEHLRLIIESVTDLAVYTADTAGRVTSWNAGAERIQGYGVSEVLGRPCSLFDLREDAIAGRSERAMKIAAREGRHEEESWRVRKDGSRFFAHIVTTVLRDASGGVRGFGRVVRDLSERRESEAGLARLAATVEASADAIIGNDLDGTILTWNQGAELLYGYTRAEMVGRSITAIVPPDELEGYHGLMQRIRGGERLSGVEVTRLRKDGTRVEVSLSISSVRDTGGVIAGASVVARDITARKRNEEALRRSEARLRAVLETAVDCIITIDARGRIQSVNQATERKFGYAASELIGRNVSMLMPPPYRDEHDEYLARYLKTGEKRIIGTGREVQAQRKDGTVFPIDLAVSEVEPGRLFTGIIRDISERQLAEKKLREADRMASIGTLAAGLGHDMNNVLLPVRAHLNVLKAGREGAAKQREHLDRIGKGVAYLQQLADGLHFLAMDPERTDEGGGATDLRAWWHQTGSLLMKAVPRHVQVSASLPATLPLVAVAPHALTQAVLNLIVNAGEAIPPGRTRRQGRVRLRAELSDDQQWVTLSVADNGTGMSEEVQRRAFDMFFTTKPRGLGTGLGLALVRKVVDRVGGSIRVASEHERGTTIELVLPVHEVAGEEEEFIALVRIADGRAASIVRSLLEAFGAAVIGDDDTHSADVWIVEPTLAELGGAAAWRQERPGRRVVLFGAPEPSHASQWQALEPLLIDDPDDFEAIRTAIGEASTRA